MDAIVEANIAARGIHVYVVEDCYMYTIGNTRIGAPELFARCTPGNISALHALFNYLHGRARDGEMKPITLTCDGERYILREPPDEEHLKAKMLGATKLYGDFQVLELIPPVKPFDFVQASSRAICKERVRVPCR
jgi:hypothetical protein